MFESDFAPLARARSIISTVPHLSVNLILVETVREVGFDGDIAVTAHHDHDARVLAEEEGVSVLRPFPAAADQVIAGLVDPTPDAHDQG